MIRWTLSLFFSFFFLLSFGQNKESHLSEIGPGWSANSVNAPIFRKNSLVSAGRYQFVAYYDSLARVVLARRIIGSDRWTLAPTPYTGKVTDAHNSISIMADGDGYLHMSWDHHNNPLRYCRSLSPYSLEMGSMEPMTGNWEEHVSYPEFYRFPNDDLLFVYRDGGSGNGNMILNRYHTESRKWERLHDNLLDGEGKRNAYWQLCIDLKGCIHLSWVWRETPDVRTNHDLCYARSFDVGLTWQNSRGQAYDVPITQSTAEVIRHIPQGSNLINQTSICADRDGNPYIATYFRDHPDACTQVYVLFRQQGEWRTEPVGNRTLDFDLGGTGSRSIPLSRPQVICSGKGRKKKLHVVFRDEEVGDHIVLATAFLSDSLQWKHRIISPRPVGRWEPSYDTELFRKKNKVHLYFQNVGQGQGETTVALVAQTVGVLEVIKP
ncbi:MAG TPA: BNR repeat-containing protein [Prolixibacteraceae bacterium]|nr:BNR repeat-containing protein [Prolixibacteraceae bacterium]